MTDRLAEIEARVKALDAAVADLRAAPTKEAWDAVAPSVDRARSNLQHQASGDVPYLLAEVERLREALGECITDLNIAANNADHAAKTDPRWEGVGAVLRSRATSARTALEAKHD
jgi:hypothetical protein